MQRLNYIKAVSVVCALFLGTAAHAATGQGTAASNDSTWISLLNASGRTSSSVASAASLDGSPIDGLFEPRTVSVAARRMATPPSGSAELTGSLVACGLLYRILRRRRVL